MAAVSPGQFVREVRQELSKVTWPTRRETVMTVVVVFVFATILGIYFLIVDKILAWIMSYFFG